MKWIICATLLPLLCLIVGCSSSPYEDGFFYVPRPVAAEIPATQPSQPPPVAVFATVVGIRTEDKKLALPESVEVRLRIDNNGPEAVTFDPRSMDLSTGDLVRFPPATFQSTSPFTLTPGESAIVTANFPFPDGKSYDDFNLESLQLQWVVQIGPQPVKQVADFRQDYRAYYYYNEGPYPYYYQPGPYVGGVVVIHRR